MNFLFRYTLATGELGTRTSSTLNLFPKYASYWILFYFILLAINIVGP